MAALALGVGLSTAMFSILWGTVLRGLPFQDADRLVRVASLVRGESVGPTREEYLRWLVGRDSLEGLAAWQGGSFNLSGGGLEAVRCNGAYVSARLFRLFEVRPQIGRDFNPSDETPQAPSVALLSAKLWKNQFNGDTRVLGKIIRINGLPAQIIGVMPDGVEAPLRQELWLPLQLEPGADPDGPAQRVQVLGKLREGVRPRQAAADLRAATPPNLRGERRSEILVMPFVQAYTEDLRPTLYLLFAASIGLLLIVCSNLSGLLAAQTIARLPELAVRSAIGASRARLLGQMTAETAVLALLGAIFGLPLAWAATRLYLASQGGELPSFWMDVRLDGPAIGYSFAIAFLTGSAAAGAPALRATGRRLAEILKGGEGSASPGRTGRFGGFRIILPVAIAFTLLAATGLVLISLRKMERLDFGKDPGQVLTGQLLLPSGYSQPADRRLFLSAVEGSLVASLGSAQVSFASALPGNAVDEAEIEIEGQPLPAGFQAPRVPYLIVSRGYFQLLRVPSLQGRYFDTSDREGGPPAAIVNQRFARRFFGSRPPVGARFRSLSSYGPGPWRTIVGVVPDLVWGEASSASSPGFYVPFEQAPPAWVSILLRSSVSVESAATALRKAVAAVDREIPVFWVRSLQLRIEDLQMPLRTLGRVFLAFGLAGFFLSLLGVYGITAQAVAGRSREMALRLALGGRRSDLVRLVLSRALLQVVAGVGLGVLASLATFRFLATRLYDIQAWEPGLLWGVGGSFVLAGTLACFPPLAKIFRLRSTEVLRA